LKTKKKEKALGGKTRISHGGKKMRGEKNEVGLRPDQKTRQKKEKQARWWKI